MLKWVQVSLFLGLLVITGWISYSFLEGQLIGTVTIFIIVSATLIVFTIFIENRDPSQTLNWILIFAVFPVIGFFFYLLFGRNYKRKSVSKRKKKQMKKHSTCLKSAGYLTMKKLSKWATIKKCFSFGTGTRKFSDIL